MNEILYIPNYKSELEISNIIHDYNNEASYKFLEVKYGITKGQISYILKRNNIETRLKRLTNQQEDEIIENYINNINVSNIASTFQVNRNTVYYVLKKYGIKTNRKKKFNEEDKYNAIEMIRKEDMKIYEVADLFDVSEETISKALRKHNIPIPKKYNKDSFKEMVKKLTNNDFIVLDEYTRMDKPISFLHKKCGNIVVTTPSSFLLSKENKNRKGVCHHCSKLIRITTDTFKQKVSEMYSDEFNVLGDYINSNTNIIIRHTTCGNLLNVLPRHFLSQKSYCSYCNKNRLKTTEEFAKEVYNLIADEYVVLGTYTNSREPITMQHKICGNSYKVTPDNFLRGRRCTKCCNLRNSLGSKKTEQYLELNNIPFLKEYTDPRCKNVKLLRFDFAIIINNEVKMLIEFDGVQHKKPQDLFGGEEQFIKQKKHDVIKNEFAGKYKIKLIRINHDQIKHIETILDNELKNFKYFL